MGARLIKITSGTGSGDTDLSAFDAALLDAGIANYNLLPLSSIIPEGFEPVREKPKYNDKEFGHRLYVVIAQDRKEKLGEAAWAGIGWVMSKKRPRRGLFVEHHGASRKEVVADVKDSLAGLQSRRPVEYDDIDYEVIGITCRGKPVCALVAAVYQSESWG